MKLIWRLTKQVLKYKGLYIISILSTLALTAVNLVSPKILSAITGIIQQGVDKVALDRIVQFALILLGLYLLRALFRFLSSYLSHRAAWFLVGEIRSKIYDKLQQFPMSYFRAHQTGDLMSRVVNDTRNFEQLYAHSIPELITNLITFVGVFVILLSTNWRLALLTCCPLPLVLASSWLFSAKIRPVFRKNHEITGELNAVLQDNISGMQEIQSFVMEKAESERVHEINNRFVKAMLKALKLSGAFHPGVEFITSLSTVIVVGFGGFLAYKNQAALSDIVAFVLYLSMFYTPVTNLAKMLEDLQQTLAGAERAMDIADAPVDIHDAPNAYPLTDVSGELEFKNISFSYDGVTPVLKNINFKCEKGKMVAVVGPTGVGKTTLSQLISRTYDPTSGIITIDGHNISAVTLESLRRNISPVLQDTFLFNATIADNIRYAKPGASMDEIIAAARSAHIHDDITAMPNGYDTVVGERGTRLSGGQKQRISIARAILKNAPVIIMDEATASVDSETEREIQKAVNELTGSHTLLVIAHRLSTIKNADNIIVLENGEIAESGTHEELMEKGGIYCRMAKIQGIS